MHLYIYMYIVKLVTIVEGDPKDPFSVATIPRCMGGRYSFPYRVEFSSEWSNRVAISVYCKSLHIWIVVSVAVKRMYVNSINCDS